jgi:hypothetical protein
MAPISEKMKIRMLISVMISAVLSAILFLTLDNAVLYVPLVFVVPVATYAMTTEQKKDIPGKLMSESPVTVGMMASVILSGGSLDPAVRYVSENGPAVTKRMFRKVVRETDLRMSCIKEGLIAILGTVHNDASPFKRSMHMLISSCETSDISERKRMIGDAENITLTGLKEMGDVYSASLNNPCMMIFGLGVMIPMILMSVMPMLSMGGMFSVTALNTVTIGFLTLVVIPAIVSLVVISIVSNNPFQERRTSEDRTFLVLFSSLPLFIISYLLTEEMFRSLMISMIAAGTLTFAATFKAVSDERMIRKTETSLHYVFFELGNRLLSGKNFEGSLIDALDTRKECIHLSGKFRRCVSLFRGDIIKSLNIILTGYSKEIIDGYVSVYESSCRDTRDSGRLSVSIGHQMQDRMQVKRNIRNKLKSITDMMTGTSVFFAPLIMGMSIVLLKPMSSISGMVMDSDVMIILAVYLIELALLLSVLTSYLGNNGDPNSIANRFSIMMSVGLAVFALFAGLNV